MANEERVREMAIGLGMAAEIFFRRRAPDRARAAMVTP